MIGQSWFCEESRYNNEQRKTNIVVVEVKISGETPREWTWIEPGTEDLNEPKIWSIPKTGGDVREARRAGGIRVRTKTVYASMEALECARKKREEALWAEKHRWAIARKVNDRDVSAEVLRQIAVLVGYAPEEK